MRDWATYNTATAPAAAAPVQCNLVSSTGDEACEYHHNHEGIHSWELGTGHLGDLCRATAARLEASNYPTEELRLLAARALRSAGQRLWR